MITKEDVLASYPSVKEVFDRYEEKLKTLEAENALLKEKLEKLEKALDLMAGDLQRAEEREGAKDARARKEVLEKLKENSFIAIWKEGGQGYAIPLGVIDQLLAKAKGEG